MIELQLCECKVFVRYMFAGLGNNREEIIQLQIC